MARILGIDEAGRGSAIGPLAVGAFLVQDDRIEELRATGAADSKTLSPARREAIYAELAGIGQRRAILVPPRDIDRVVPQRGLNRLEAEEFARLVRAFAPDEARLDACDANAPRFGLLVARLAGGNVRVVARHKADRDDVVVGAASIVAKVRRDRAIRALRRRLGTEVGSGYPSDPTTIAFLRACCAGGTAPEYVRRSWATMKRVMPAPSGPTLDAFGP